MKQTNNNNTIYREVTTFCTSSYTQHNRKTIYTEVVLFAILGVQTETVGQLNNNNNNRTCYLYKRKKKVLLFAISMTRNATKKLYL